MNNLKDVSVLITGGCGMVGSHLAEYYHSKGERVVATFYTQPTIRLEEVMDKATYVPCDVRERARVEELIGQYRPEVIYHLAAQSYPTVSWEKPSETMDINANGTINVFEAVKTVKKSNPEYDPVILIACSSAEYGASLTPENVPIKEDAMLLPLHPYGVSKVAQDLLGFQYFVNDGIRSIRVRIFNTTGPRKTNDVASDFIKRAVLFERGEINVLTTGTLTTQRAITDVRDLVQALVLLSQKGKAGEVYNVCGNNIYEIRDILALIEEIIGQPIPYEEDPALIRSSDEPVIYGSSERLIAATGWQQSIPLKTTLADMINYQRSIS